MRIFFDTEFTSLGVTNPDLISAGLLTEDGQHELYLEFRDFTREKCSQFVRETVLPLLDAPAEHRLPLIDFGNRLAAWLDAFNEPIDLVSDSEIDGRLISAALADHLANLQVRTVVVGVESREALEVEYRYWQNNPGKQHHALYDARCLRLMRLALEEEFKQRWREQ